MGGVANYLAALPNTFSPIVTVFTPFPDWTIVAPAKINRVWIGFYNGDGSAMSLGLPDGLGGTTLIHSMKLSDIVEIYLERHKILPSLDWYALAANAFGTLTVVEVIYTGG